MSKATTQVKVTLETSIVESFKARCASESVSMTSAVRQWMRTSHVSKEPTVSISTRPQRRKAVEKILVLLTDILDSETDYRDGIPEQFAQRREAADHACESLADAICSLEEAF